MQYERNDAMAAKWSADSEEGAQGRSSKLRRGCRVLVVDDDDLVRARLCAVLDAAQYEVEAAATGEEAMRILDATRCHVVLTDWQMPDMDGLTLCRHVRRRNQDGYVYVLMLTVRGTEDDMLTGLAAGADHYMVKGATTEEILAHVEIGRRISHRRPSLQPAPHDARALSYIDPVTGAHNLSYLVQHLPRELARARRYGHPLAVLSCTIHGIKSAANSPGSALNDEWLQAFVASAGACVRTSDWIARTGLDEFMVVLPETSAKGAQCTARKLRQLFAPNPLSTASASTGITANIEVISVEAKYEAGGASRINALLRAADCSIYVGTGPGADQLDPGAPFGKNELN